MSSSAVNYDELEPIAIALSIQLILAFPANLLIVLRSIPFCRKIENNSFIFLFGLALSDLLVTVFFIAPLCVYYVILVTDRELILEWNSQYCKFEWFLFEVSFAISLVILTLLAIENFFYVYKTEVYKKFVKSKLVYGLTVATWVSLGSHF